MLVVSDHPARWYVATLPAIWFVGLSFSRLVFKRCVLNEIAVRLRKTKKKAQERIRRYDSDKAAQWDRHYRRPLKAVVDVIGDQPQTPDLKTLP